MFQFLRTNPRSRDTRMSSRSGSQAPVFFGVPHYRSFELSCNYPLAINSSHCPPSSHTIPSRSYFSLTLPPAMAPPFVFPSPNGLCFVIINPNIDAFNAVPLADGSPDLLFAIFGQGHAMDFDAILAQAQESLSTSIFDYSCTWIVLHSDGTMVLG